jgi:hypothetical protein
MKFHLEANLVFEAGDLKDAQRRIAAHFLRSSMEDGGVVSFGPEGYIHLVPADDDGDGDADDALPEA